MPCASGKRRNAPRRPFRPTAGRVPLTARRVAARLWWMGTTARTAPSERTKERGQMGHYQRPLVYGGALWVSSSRPRLAGRRKPIGRRYRVQPLDTSAGGSRWSRGETTMADALRSALGRRQKRATLCARRSQSRCRGHQGETGSRMSVQRSVEWRRGRSDQRTSDLLSIECPPERASGFELGG